MELSVRISQEDLGFSPKAIKSLLSKLAHVQEIVQQASAIDKVRVHLDFGPENSHDLSTAIIWRLLHEYQTIPCDKTILYKEQAQRYFDERHFFERLTGRKSTLFGNTIPINFETFNPTRPTADNNQNELINSVFDRATKNIFDDTKDFDNELKIQIIECVTNSFDHSESGLKPAGILCTLRESKIIEFCIADMGQGMRKSFLSNPALKEEYQIYKDHQVISKAVQKGISCNPSSARNPNYAYGNAGIGLYYLNEFVRTHPESKLVIISGNGYYYSEYRSNLGKTFTLTSPWPGTIIYFRTKLGQEKSEAYRKLAEQVVSEFDNRVIKL